MPGLIRPRIVEPPAKLIERDSQAEVFIFCAVERQITASPADD